VGTLPASHPWLLPTAEQEVRDAASAAVEKENHVLTLSSSTPTAERERNTYIAGAPGPVHYLSPLPRLSLTPPIFKIEEEVGLLLQ